MADGGLAPALAGETVPAAPALMFSDRMPHRQHWDCWHRRAIDGDRTRLVSSKRYGSGTVGGDVSPGGIPLMQTSKLLAAVALGVALLGPGASAALAQGKDGDSQETAVAVGVDGGLVTTGEANMAPDQPTTVSVGGDSNLGVAQPDLGRVPAGNSDGVFSVSAPSISGPVFNSGGTVTGERSSSVVAPTVEEGIDASAVQSGDESVAASEEEAVYVPGCADYPTWYDAQIALEEATDAALVEALDPDYNGIACETGMV
jgi:hypothetical protein